MMIKKTIALLLALSMSLSLTACSGDDIKDTKESATDMVGDTVSFLWNTSKESRNFLFDSALNTADLAKKWASDALSPKAEEFFRSTKDASDEAKNILSSYYEYYREAGPDAADLKGYLNDLEHQKDMKFNDLYALLGDSNTIVIPGDHIDEAKDYIRGDCDELTAIDGDGSSQHTQLYTQSMESLKKRHEDPDEYEQVSPTYGELLAAAQMCKDGDFTPDDFGISMSTVISPKYVLKQAVGTYLGADSMNAVLKIGPKIYGILKDEMNKEGIDKSTLEKEGLAAVIASSDGAVESSVSSVLKLMLEDEVDDSDPSVMTTLTFLTIEGAIHGYDLSKGVITPEEYGDIMAESLMTSLLALPSNSVLLAILPSAQVTMIAGCMAGGMLVCMGYDETSTQEAAMNMINGGGFEAIVPADMATEALSLTNEIFNVTGD